MLAIQLKDGDPSDPTPDAASIDGFLLRKDISIPFIPQRYVTVEIEEQNAQITGNGITLYTTQLYTDDLTLVNVEVTEGEGTQKWGPNSGELIIRGGQNTAPGTDGIRASEEPTESVEAWIHGLSGQGVTFDSPESSSIEIRIEYPTQTEVNNFYSTGTEDGTGNDPRLGYGNEGNRPWNPGDSNPEASVPNRNEYFQCGPL
jgi:hypothetical protein